MRHITLDAPAKLNLGLEVIGRRDDGYHDIATIFQAISLVDTVTLNLSPSLHLATATTEVANEDNLVFQALERLRDTFRIDAGAVIELTKRIPIAAGLGGASSDAATAMLAALELWDVTVPTDHLESVSLHLGSDVPFFLHGGTALATSRGEVLTPLPQPQVWFVVVSPKLVIPRKTATLYTALTPADFSPGDQVRQLARRLAAGNPIDPVLLDNAFARPLLEIAPSLRDLQRQMLVAGAPFFALSGAGPTHYTVISDPLRAQHLATALRARLGSRAEIFVCQAVGPHGLLPD